jgi:general secretion pathway protein D
MVSSVSDLTAFQFDISFDPAVLAAAGIAEGAFLSSGGTTFFSPGDIDNTAGLISFTAGTLLGPGAGVNGSGTLASLNFDAIALGTSPIALSNVILIDSTLAEIPSAVSGGSVRVTVIPEPGPALPVMAGIITALGLARFRAACDCGSTSG